MIQWVSRQDLKSMMVGELSYSQFAGRSGEQTHVQPQFLVPQLVNKPAKKLVAEAAKAFGDND